MLYDVSYTGRILCSQNECLTVVTVGVRTITCAQTNCEGMKAAQQQRKQQLTVGVRTITCAQTNCEGMKAAQQQRKQQ
jgi:hypothetical protein